MRKITILAASVAALSMTLSGCVLEDKSSQTCDIKFSSNIDRIATRAGTDAFVAGHEIGIYMHPTGEGVAHADAEHNALYRRTEAGGFAPGNGHTLYWPEFAVDFFAYYPHQAGVESDSHSYEFDLAEQVDLLYSDAVTNRTEGEVAFTFHHEFSKLIFNVTDEDTEAVLAGMRTKIDGVHTWAMYDLAEGEMVGTDEPGVLEIAAPKTAANNTATVEAIVFPGTAVTYTVVFTLADGTVTEPVSITDTYAPDFAYSYNVTINKDKDRVEVEIVSGEIDDWGEGTVGNGNYTTDKEPKPVSVIKPEDLEVPTELQAPVGAAGGTFAIGYTITNPVVGAEFSAVPSADWIEVLPGTRAAENSVSIKVLANGTEESRSATLALRYDGKDLIAPIVINQAAGTPGETYTTLFTQTGIPGGGTNSSYRANITGETSDGTSWTTTHGNNVALGSNNSNATNMVLGETYAAVGTPFGYNASTGRTAAMVSGATLANVGRITVTARADAGIAMGIAYSSDGETWSIWGELQSLTSGTKLDYTFTPSAVQSSAYYAIVVSKPSNSSDARVQDFGFKVETVQ